MLLMYLSELFFLFVDMYFVCCVYVLYREMIRSVVNECWMMKGFKKKGDVFKFMILNVVDRGFNVN